MEMGILRTNNNNEPEVEVANGNYNSGRWSVEEHELFLTGLRLHGRNWKMIQSLIQTRSSTQVRTHAQKFFTRDNYQATKRGRYASRLKDIETPDMLDDLRASGTLPPPRGAETRNHFVRKKIVPTTSSSQLNSNQLPHLKLEHIEDYQLTQLRMNRNFNQDCSARNNQEDSEMNDMLLVKRESELITTRAFVTTENANNGPEVNCDWQDISSFVEPLDFLADGALLPENSPEIKNEAFPWLPNSNHSDTINHSLELISSFDYAKEDRCESGDSLDITLK